MRLTEYAPTSVPKSVIRGQLRQSTATPPIGPDGADSDTAEVTVDAPGMTLVKSPASQDVPVGGTATFKIAVDNTGNVDLTGVVLSDPQCTTLAGQFDTADIPHLLP